MTQQLRRRHSHRLIKALVRRQRLIATLHRKRTPFGNNHRGIREQTLQLVVIKGSRHDQQLEVIAKPLLNVQQQRQREIGLQAAFMEFIEDH